MEKSTLLILAGIIAAIAAIGIAIPFVDKLKRRTVAILAVVLLPLYASCLIMQPRSLLLADLLVLAVALLAGRLLSPLLRDRAGLFAFFIVASGADLFSFVSGPTRRLLDSYHSGASRLLEYLCFSLPYRHYLIPIVGIGDLFILSAVALVMIKLGRRTLAAVCVPGAGLLLAVAAALLLKKGLPAVPFIAALTTAWILLFAHPRTR